MKLLYFKGNLIMSEIGSNFVNQYVKLKDEAQKNNKELTNDQLKDLVKGAVNTLGNDPKALDSLKNEIFKDGRIDDTESKLLFMIGFASDSSDTKGYEKIKSHLMPPNDSRVSELMDKGFEQGKTAVNKYREWSGVKSTARDILNTVTFGNVESADQVVKNKNTKVVKELDDSLKSLETSSQKTNCVKNALDVILGKGSKFGDQGEVVSEKTLNEATGVQDKDKSQNGWDAIAPAKKSTEELKELLKNYSGDNLKGNALVIVGAHAYVLKSIDTDGNMKVIDPSDKNQERTIQKNNPSATVYVQKSNSIGGDGAVSSRIATDSNGLTLEQFKNSKISNSSDTSDKTGESLNIRKLLVLVGDKSQKPEDRQALYDAIKNKNISGLQKILEKQGIKIDMQELKAFMSIMNTSVKGADGKSTSMIKELEKLTSNQSTNHDRGNYSNGVVYSDISLKDYFTKTSPQTIYNTFQDMINGRDGC